ncbi:DNA polymerase-3 subunit epsilon [bacterium A37T11]|nr:DNA polymerase-3 subunit epsilon [bacterium A37T11]
MWSFEINPEYAIVDIETTGSYPSGCGMTEIAIVIYNGCEVIERYETLINPFQSIPLSIQALTGITDTMVQHSPPFAHIADKVYSLLKGRIFVAHNVNFDYSFVRHQLQKEGYSWTAPKLCTVRLSRKIRPGLRSYSLGKLCEVLGIAIFQRHRAGGDADATAILFGLLLKWDKGGHIQEMLKRTSKDQQLPPNLSKEEVDVLPESPGVYYFKDRAGKVLYVGKALNLRKRVISHFAGFNEKPQRQNFLRNIYHVDYELCGTELMALILESIEIKRLWPPYNRALKGLEPKYALFMYEDNRGYFRLAVGMKQKHQQCVHMAYRQYELIGILQQLIQEFDLYPGFCSFGSEHKLGYHSFFNGGDLMANLPSPESYNLRVIKAIDHLKHNLPSYAILDKGRNGDEKSCVWMEKGQFYGMGFINAYCDLDQFENVRDSLTRYTGNHYITQIISAFAEKYPWKIFKF